MEFGTSDDESGDEDLFAGMDRMSIPQSTVTSTVNEADEPKPSSKASAAAHESRVQGSSKAWAEKENAQSSKACVEKACARSSKACARSSKACTPQTCSATVLPSRFKNPQADEGDLKLVRQRVPRGWCKKKEKSTITGKKRRKKSSFSSRKKVPLQEVWWPARACRHPEVFKNPETHVEVLGQPRTRDTFSLPNEVMDYSAFWDDPDFVRPYTPGCMQELQSSVEAVLTAEMFKRWQTGMRLLSRAHSYYQEKFKVVREIKRKSLLESEPETPPRKTPAVAHKRRKTVIIPFKKEGTLEVGTRIAYLDNLQWQRESFIIEIKSGADTDDRIVLESGHLLSPDSRIQVLEHPRYPRLKLQGLRQLGYIEKPLRFYELVPAPRLPGKLTVPERMVRMARDKRKELTEKAYRILNGGAISEDEAEKSADTDSDEESDDESDEESDEEIIDLT